MENRPNPLKLTPELVQQAIKLEETIAGLGLDARLSHLLKTRVSQLNGCAYCLHIHTADALKAGESNARLHVLAAWRESTLFTLKERAVLAYAEALTLIATQALQAAPYDALGEHFSDVEIIALTHAIGMINFWNRCAIGLGKVHPSERAQR